MSKREFRQFKTELRTQMVDGKPKIVGYGSVYNQMSEPMSIGRRTFREVVMPGAFDKCLASNPDIRGLVNHDASKVLGRTTAGTMTVTSDGNGLKYEIDPPDTTYCRDLMVSMERGDINQSSFGFFTVADDWAEGSDGELIRTLKEVDCFDVSPVTYPAYRGASSGLEMRSAFPDGVPESVAEHTEDCAVIEQPKPAESREAKTKKVDGHELHASDFAHVGDPNDTSTWKFPIHDADHARNALARFSQAKGLSADEKKAAWSKITAAAKKFGIHVSEQNSAALQNASFREAKKIVRAMDPDNDGDDDEPLIMALCEAREGCDAVSGTLSSALWSFFDGDKDYFGPLFEAGVKQIDALIADLNAAKVQLNAELSEPAPQAELNARKKRWQERFANR